MNRYMVRNGETNQVIHIAPFTEKDWAISWAELDDDSNRRLGRPRYHYLLVKDEIVVGVLDWRKK